MDFASIDLLVPTIPAYMISEFVRDVAISKRLKLPIPVIDFVDHVAPASSDFAIPTLRMAAY